jgi:hypothetical protein
MPLLAYAGAFDGFWLLTWGSLSTLTTFTTMYLYTRPVDPLHIPFVPGFFQVVGIRNLLFIIATLVYLFNWFDSRRRRPVRSTITGRETRPLYQNIEHLKEVLPPVHRPL